MNHRIKHSDRRLQSRGKPPKRAISAVVCLASLKVRIVAQEEERCSYASSPPSCSPPVLQGKLQGFVGGKGSGGGGGGGRGYSTMHTDDDSEFNIRDTGGSKRGGDVEMRGGGGGSRL